MNAPAHLPIRPNRHDSADHLVSTLQDIIGPDYVVTWRGARPWASITFSGVRHKLSIRCDAQRAELLPSRLADIELTIARYFLADLILTETHCDSDNPANTCLEVEALLILDPVRIAAA